MNFRYIVVDDAPFIRELIKSVLNSVGAVCVGEAEDGVAGASLVSSVLPDIVFLDLVMPKKNGIETLKEMKELWPDVKVIICSTVDQEHMIDKAKLAGADSYLTKPFTKEDIISAVQKLNQSNQEANS